MIDMRLFVRCCLCATLIHAPATAQSPGSKPPRELIERIEPAAKRLIAGLQAEDAAAVRVGVEQALAVLGPWAGIPETATKHHPPADPAAYDPQRLKVLWLEEIDKHLRGMPWRKNPNGDPRAMNAGLREAAVPLDALARTALLFPEHRERLKPEVKAGADWLVERQLADGGFPFPIGPALRPREKVGRMVAEKIRRQPDLVIDGWIPDDRGDGGLQFDQGLCTRALVSAWELTGEPRYSNAARLSGSWIMARPLVPNWNYNAFSVGALAELAQATGDRRFLDSAVRKAEIGVLPGQMVSGRWFDAHNACAVYHDILIRELLNLRRAITSEHPLARTLDQSIVRGLDQAAEETLSLGYSGTWTGIFADGLRQFGDRPRWRDALRTNVNGAGKAEAPDLGTSVIAVMELDFREKLPAAPPLAQPLDSKPETSQE